MSLRVYIVQGVPTTLCDICRWRRKLGWEDADKTLSPDKLCTICNTGPKEEEKNHAV